MVRSSKIRLYNNICLLFVSLFFCVVLRVVETVDKSRKKKASNKKAEERKGGEWGVSTEKESRANAEMDESVRVNKRVFRAVHEQGCFTIFLIRVTQCHQ